MRVKVIFCGLVVSAALRCMRAASDQPPAVAPKVEPRFSRLHMLDSRNGWALVFTNESLHPRLVLTRDGGEGWSDRTPTESQDSELGQVYFLDAKRGWVFVSDRKNGGDSVMITDNGGESWKQTQIPFYVTEGLNAQFFSADHGVARQEDGGLGSIIFNYCETRDGGKTWKPLIITPPHGGDPNEPPGTIHLCSLCGDRASFNPPATVIIAYGDAGDEKPKGAVRLSHSSDLGKSWHDLDLLLPEQCHDGLCEPLEPVFFGEKKVVLPVRVYKQNVNDTYVYRMMVFYVSDDGGDKWMQAPAIVEFKDPDFEANENDVASPRDFFVHADGNLLVTHDGAKSWQTIKPNIAFGGLGREVGQMDFTDATHGWVVIYDPELNTHERPCHLYRTSDSGKTWVELKMQIRHSP